MAENKHIEYKQKLTSEMEEDVVAFLNSNEGGIIYIGVNKDCFKFSDNFLQVVLPSNEVTNEKGRLADGLVESQQMILKLVAKNAKISKREMAETIGISTTAID